MMAMMAIDLFCGLGGWTEGLLSAGFDVVGFDVEDHRYGEHSYPGRLVLQDVRTLHGSRFRDARLIVASPPCQKYSYMAMPWTKAKTLASWYRNPEHPERLDELNELFAACFRIQREASEAAGRHIPLIVENVCGAQKWVGKARGHYGSYYLWGDVPALLPVPPKRGSGAYKSSGMNWSDRSRKGQDFTRVAGAQAIKNSGGSWFRIAHGRPGEANDPRDNPALLPIPVGQSGIKCGGDWFSSGSNCSTPRRLSSRGPVRKVASALIAKIPFALAAHVGWVYGARAPLTRA